MSYIKYENNRYMFSLIRKGGEAFSFAGGNEFKKEGNIYRIEIDSVFKTDAKNIKPQKQIPVLGQCIVYRMDSPQPMITCRAISDDDEKFELVFNVAKTSKITAPKSPGPDVSKKIFNQCAYVSQVGLYYPAAIGRAGTQQGQLAYIIKKMQQRLKVKDPRKLQRVLNAYMTLLQKIDDFKPDTSAAYVLGACVAMHSMKKKLPVDTESVQKINALLKNCEKTSINRKVLNDCVGPKLMKIVRGGNQQGGQHGLSTAPEVYQGKLDKEKYDKIIGECGYVTQIGMYFNEAKENTLTSRELDAYILSKIQQIKKSKNPEHMEKVIQFYVGLLQKLDKFDSDTYGAYVLGACASMRSLNKRMPDEDDAVRKINAMLRKCRQEFPIKKTLGPCVLKGMKPIISRSEIKLPDDAY